MQITLKEKKKKKGEEKKVPFVFENKARESQRLSAESQRGGRREEGRRGDAEDEDREGVTLRVFPDPCQRQRRWPGCAGTSETGQTAAQRRELRTNKEPRLRSRSRRAACVQLLLCHTQNAPLPQGAVHAGSTWRTYSCKEAPPPSVCARCRPISACLLSRSPLCLSGAAGGEWWQSC